MKNRLWVVPNNDLEAQAIIKLLKRNQEQFLVTGQSWGASWENLEDEIKQKILIAKQNKTIIYGIELQGNSNGAINIDHHTYGNDNRSNPASSIEQTATILGVDLTLKEMFIAANDKGYIPAMEKLGIKMNLSKQDLNNMIALIRLQDRQMQGITSEQEQQAQIAIEKLGKITEKQTYISIELPHSKTATVQDRLYGKFDNLLITSADGETNFYGITPIIKMLNEKFPGGWCGGQLDQGRGFWGGYADQNAIKKEVQIMIEKLKINNDKSNISDNSLEI